MAAGGPSRGPVTSLAVGSIVAGALAYVFFVTATRTLGPREAAAVSVLWTYWGFTAAAITFPLQHWIARTVEVTGGERAVRTALPRLAVGLLGLAAVAAGASALAGERLFATTGIVFPVLVALVTLGAGLLGVMRGHQTAQGRFTAVGVSLVLENGTRSLAALALAAAGHDEAAAFGVALVLGYAVALCYPRSLVSWRVDGAPNSDRPVAAVGATGFGQLCSQVVLTGAPVVLAVGGGRPQDVTAVFAGLALFRAPYTVGVALLAPVNGWLTRLWLRAAPSQWRRVELGVAAAAVVGALAAAAAAWWVGPWLIALVFGADVVVTRPVAAMLAAGTALAMATTVVTVMLVAMSRTAALLRAWIAAGVVGVCWTVLAPVGVVASVAMLFLVLEAVALSWLAVEQARATTCRTAGREDGG